MNVKVMGREVVRLVLEGLEREGSDGSDLRALGLQNRVSVRLVVPAGDSLDEEDFSLVFVREEAEGG